MFNKGIFAAIGAFILAVLYTIKRVFDSREKEAQKASIEAGSQAAATKANNDARTSSETARETEKKINQEVSDVETKADTDRAAVASGSLRDGSDAIQAAINRANGGV